MSTVLLTIPRACLLRSNNSGKSVLLRSIFFCNFAKRSIADKVTYTVEIQTSEMRAKPGHAPVSVENDRSRMLQTQIFYGEGDGDRDSHAPLVLFPYLRAMSCPCPNCFFLVIHYL